MKGIILYSSSTGNTARFAEKLRECFNPSDQWSVHNVKDGVVDVSDVDVVLIGGWVDAGQLNKEAVRTLESLDLTHKKVGFFLTMGASPESEHGKYCYRMMDEIARRYDSVGVQILQGRIAAKLLERLAKVPDTAIPKQIKEAMYACADTYREPTDEDYKAAARNFEQHWKLQS